MTPIFSQCNENVDAGDDVHICEDGIELALDGFASGNPIFTTWSPSNIISDINNLQTTANITEPVTIKLNAVYDSTDGNELVVNGDFEDGNTAFTSELSHLTATGAQLTFGTYMITDAPEIAHEGWPSCDHVTGSGQMMVIYGNEVYATGNKIWCQTIDDIIPGKTYKVSAMLGSLTRTIPEELYFEINGKKISDMLQFSTVTCDWVTYAAHWTAPTDVDVAEFCIIEKYKPSDEPGACAHYALDNISMQTSCDAEDELQVFFDAMTIEVNEPEPLTCINTETVLNGIGTSPFGYDHLENWRTDDGAFEGDGFTNSIVATAPGTYIYTFYNHETTCFLTKEVEVIAEIEYPIARATTNLELNCDVTELTLDGSLSSQGDNIIYNWTTSDGNIVSGAQTLNPIVDKEGVYTLTVTIENTGCDATTEVLVTNTAAMPLVVVAPSEMLTCNKNTILLDASSSDVGDQITYSWTTADGSILSGANTLQAIIESPGEYTLSVLNSANGCRNEVTINVQENKIIPELEIPNPDPLTCNTKEVTIIAQASSIEENPEIIWMDQNGSVVSNELAFITEVAGQYELRVVNTETGCEATESVYVSEEKDEPNFSIQDLPLLDCFKTSASINVNIENEESFSFEWSTTNGTFLNGIDSPKPEISSAGEYSILVVNNLTGCSSEQTISIEENKVSPKLEIEEPQTLTCLNDVIQLVSQSDDDLEYLWSSVEQNEIINANAAIASISQAGSYQLTITNPQNGCETTASIQITEDKVKPSVEFMAPEIVTCKNDKVQIQISNNTDLDILSFEWSTPDGIIQEGIETGSPIVSSAGSYEVNITNQINGCNQTATINIEEDKEFPDVQAGANTILTCQDNMLSLNGSSTSTNIDVVWSSPNGNIMAGSNSFNPQINAPGNYILTVTDTNNGCQSIDEVSVEQDQDAPIVEIIGDKLLNCKQDQITLDATGSSSGNNISFKWSTLDGNFVEDVDKLVPSINSAGTYVLSLINNDNQCSTVSSITIEEDKEEPKIEISEPNILDCQNAQTSVEILSASEHLQIEWRKDGNIISTAVDEEIFSESGLYTIFALNTETGCDNQFEFNIEEDFEQPTADAGSDMTLTCTETQMKLSGNTENDPNLTVSWHTQDGNIISGANTLNPIIDEPGIYTMHVVNNQNACEHKAEVMVEADENIPLVNIIEPQILDCDIQSIVIDASNSSSEANLSFEWSTTNGLITNGANTLAAEVSSPGLYTLMIRNEENGCLATEEVLVEQNIELPIAEPIASSQISCVNKTAVLSTNNLSTEALSFEWLTSSGNILEGQHTNQAVVDQAGTYILTVTSLDNGCSNNFEIEVELDDNSPFAALVEPEELNCNQTLIELDGNASTQGENLSFHWTTTDGNFTETPLSLNPTIDEPGSYTLTISNEDNGCSTSKTIIVQENISLPEAQISVPELLNCTVNQTSLEINHSPELNLSYNWINQNSAGKSILVQEAGIYECEIINQDNGCSIIVQQEVEENLSIPDFDFEPAQEITCENSSVNLSVDLENGNNYSYEWSSQNGNILDLQNSQIVIVDAEGEYSLTVTNLESHCTMTKNIFVSSNVTIPEFAISEPEMLNCDIESTSIDIFVNEPDDFDFTWTLDGNLLPSNQNDPSLLVSEPGLYTVQLTDKNTGCVNTESVEITRDTELPTVNILNTYSITCKEPQIEITPNVVGQGNEFVYFWNPLNGNTVEEIEEAGIVINEAGTYELQIFNEENGCSSTEIIEVILDNTAPSVLLAEPGVLNCYNESVEITANITEVENPIIEWNAGNGNIIQSLGNSIIVNQEDRYTIHVVNAENGCSETVSIEILEDRVIPETDAGLGGLLTCDNSAFSLNGIASQGSIYTYTWSTTDGYILEGGSSLQPVINQEGSYLLTVLNEENGCTNSDPVMVLREENVPELIISDLTDPICSSDLGAINFIDVEGGYGPYLFSIDGGNTFNDTQSHTELLPGFYDIVIKDQNGCEIAEQIEIVAPPSIDVNITPSIEILYGSSQELLPNLVNIQEENIAQVLWTPSTGLSCTDCLNPKVFAEDDIIYEIQIITKDGCEANAQIEFRVDKDQSVYIPNTFSPNNDGTNDVFFINAKDGVVKIIHDFQIFDRWGNKLFLQSNFLPNKPEHGWSGTFRDVQMNSGVYVYYAKIEFIDGRKLTLKGDLTLME